MMFTEMSWCLTSYGLIKHDEAATLEESHTLWLFNIAMENGPFIDDFPIKTTIYKGFSVAMLNYQMVNAICRARGGRDAKRCAAQSRTAPSAVALWPTEGAPPEASNVSKYFWGIVGYNLTFQTHLDISNIYMYIYIYIHCIIYISTCVKYKSNLINTSIDR